MPSVTIDGFDMYFERRGEGKPLLLLHGGLGVAGDWRHVFAADPPGWSLIVPDLRGHGRSTMPGEGFTVRACAHDVIALLDHLRIDGVKAIGMSLGAKTLLHVATIDPGRIDAMVLVSATPRFPDALRTAAGAFTREALARLSDDERAFLRGRHVHGDRQLEALYDMTRSFATSHDDMAFTAATLGRITARTLIVHGDRDHLYPVELAVELFRGIPRSALWVVPDGGHGPIFGAQAAPFAGAALRHLAAETAP